MGCPRGGGHLGSKGLGGRLGGLSGGLGGLDGGLSGLGGGNSQLHHCSQSEGVIARTDYGFPGCEW